MTSSTWKTGAPDHTLRARDGSRDPALSSGHTLAGSPAGNLPATERARDELR
jgi:hypothetical protein